MGAAMIETLAGIEPRTAAGILARTALVLDGDVSNPAAKPRVLNEESIRQKVLSELRDRLGLRGKSGADANDRLYEAISSEADRLFELPDLRRAIERLSERGELPSDRYVVKIGEPVRGIYGPAFDEEEELILLTIREPHAEQHFGPRVNDDQPSLVSIFARVFRDKYPYRDFILLAVGLRTGLELYVYQAWRVYPSFVDLNGVATLTGIAERFAKKFGHDITVGTQTGKFVLWARIPAPVRHGESGKIIIVHAPPSASLQASSSFRMTTDGFIEIAFAMAIDIESYRRVLRKYSERLRRAFAGAL